jgi:hypothetical protein
MDMAVIAAMTDIGAIATTAIAAVTDTAAATGTAIAAGTDTADAIATAADADTAIDPISVWKGRDAIAPFLL